MVIGGLATRDAYLARLGLEVEPPSVDALFRLHRAHVERVPYETLWIHLGERWSVDPTESVERIAGGRRGGYCFHLNGAFSELLGSLGYDVTRHIGGVHGPDGPAGDEMTNHLVLTVRGLPSEANPEGDWYVDAGLGDALHDPLPLLPGVYEQGPFRLGLEATPGAVGDWHLTHDPAGTFTGMSWRSAPADIGAFADRHRHLSTAPDSGFVRVLSLQRRDATGVDVLRGLTLRRVGVGEREATLATRDELAGTLHDVFGIDVFGIDALSDAALDGLWTSTRRAHLEWEAAGRP
jgi:N-hydroxyarylamine O-acetyltransferase